MEFGLLLDTEFCERTAARAGGVDAHGETVEAGHGAGGALYADLCSSNVAAQAPAIGCGGRVVR